MKIRLTPLLLETFSNLINSEADRCRLNVINVNMGSSFYLYLGYKWVNVDVFSTFLTIASKHVIKEKITDYLHATNVYAHLRW